MSQTSVVASAVPLYMRALDVLAADAVPHLVGGSLAIVRHTGVQRATKDLDLFVRPHDFDRALKTLAAAGFATERTHPHWLGKARAGKHCIDLIFNSGNGLCVVDDGWFLHAREAELFGRPTQVVPVEELIWTKLFIMERERYDGADVAHLLRDTSSELDWRRLRGRVGQHWRVLLSHLVLFGFIYPEKQSQIPSWLLGELLQKLRFEGQSPTSTARLCRGTLLSRQQYLHDIRSENYQDARAAPLGSMSAQEIAAWTAAIPHEPGSSSGAK
jgi:hypothetical protein